MKRFIEDIIQSKSYQNGDLVILSGDLNINGASQVGTQIEMINAMKKTNEEKGGPWTPILNLIEDEYGSLMKTLKNESLWSIVDCLR